MIFHENDEFLKNHDAHNQAGSFILIDQKTRLGLRLLDQDLVRIRLT